MRIDKNGEIILEEKDFEIAKGFIGECQGKLETFRCNLYQMASNEKSEWISQNPSYTTYIIDYLEALIRQYRLITFKQHEILYG